MQSYTLILLKFDIFLNYFPQISVFCTCQLELSTTQSALVTAIDYEGISFASGRKIWALQILKLNPK